MATNETPTKEVVKPSNSGQKVTVACKLPNGLTVEHKGRRVTFAGSNSEGAIASHGFTRHVDKEWFDDWVNTVPSFEPIKNGLIFSQGTTESAYDAAKDLKDNPSGLEGINTKKLPKGIEPGSTKDD